MYNFYMKTIKLTKEEKDLEHSIERYVPVEEKEFKEIAQAIALKNGSSDE